MLPRPLLQCSKAAEQQADCGHTAHLRLPAFRSSAFLWDFCLTRPRMVCPALEMTLALQLLARLLLGFSLLPAVACAGLCLAGKWRGAHPGLHKSVCC